MQIVPKIVINSRPNEYEKNAILLVILIEGQTDSIYFTSPSPDLSTLSIAKVKLTESISNWGTKGNRGSKASLLDLREKSAEAYRLIKASVNYLTNVSVQLAGGDMELMANIMGTTGMPVRTSRNPQGTLGKVRNIHTVHAGGLRRNQVEWHWRRPLGVTSQNNIKFNKVFRSTINDFTTAEIIATPTKSKLIDSNDTGSMITYYYWFLAVTANSESSISDAVSITLLPA